MDIAGLLTPKMLPLVIGGVVSLPAGLFMASYFSPSRARFLSVFGGLLGAIAAAALLYLGVSASGIAIDSVTYAVSAFFVCSSGIIALALLMNGLAGPGKKRGTSRSH